MSARKVRLVADMVRGQNVGVALNRITVVPRAACKPLAKVISSAIANAQHNFQLAKNNLYIRAITVDEGTALKRWRARAYGRAAPIRKHSCSISVTLDERVPGKKIVEKKPSVSSKEKATTTTPELHSELVDTRPVSMRRDHEQTHKREGRKTKGYLKKFFNRKSG